MFKMLWIMVILYNLCLSDGDEINAEKKFIPILKNNFKQSQHGYIYSYESGNGIQVQESGYIKNQGSKNEILVMKGSYTYQDEHGNPISVTYVADENGFQAHGVHLPTNKN